MCIRDRDTEQTWLDRNLGAKGIAAASNDHTAFGSLFQWSRKADGHEKTKWTSATAGSFVNALAPLNTPTADRRESGREGFMPTNKEPHDWARDDTSNRDGLWGGRFEDKTYAAPLDAATQDNNPCPPGYRVPTVNEFIEMAKAVTGLETMVYGDTSYKEMCIRDRMDAPAERVPAWRLSEIGLTPESSGTSTGHRGIFMANYAAWMLRLAHYTGDEFLARTADHAVIGRYRNFPGYHINTARTTVYEKADYPLRGHMELGANSFHYNHIMPHISLLYDFLVTQALFRTGGKVDFPGEFIEGYAYLQSKFYGHLPGTIYGREARLWMPTGLATPADRQLNYISAVDDDALYIVVMNQAAETVETDVALDYALSGHSDGGHYRTQVIGGSGASGQLADGRFTVRVAGNGIAAVRIETPTPVRPQLAADVYKRQDSASA